MNRSETGLVLVVETATGYRALPLAAVERVELLPRRVVLTEESERALADAPPVDAEVVRIETPRLVRFVPRELTVVEGEAPPAQGWSRQWVSGAALTFVGGVVLFTGIPIAVIGVGGSLAWLWVALPAAAFALGLGLLWRAHTRAGGGTGVAAAFVLGISPPERRRPRPPGRGRS